MQACKDLALEWFVSWILDDLMKNQCPQYKIWGNILYYYKFFPIKKEKTWDMAMFNYMIQCHWWTN
jgi:hypothetical protein